MHRKRISQNMLRFEYDVMFDFYDKNPTKKNVDENGDIVCFAYESLVYSKKFQTDKKRRSKNHGTLKSFLHRGIDHVARLHDLEKTGFNESEHGIYVVTCREKRALYFVIPTMRNLGLRTSDGSALFADHFSFVIDKSDENTPLHLHKTIYLPITDSMILGRGLCLHTPLYIPDQIELSLPVSVSSFAHEYFEKDDRENAKYVLPLMLFPYSIEPIIEGGVGEKRPSSSSTIKENTEISRPRNEAFTNLWLNKPITEILAIGIRQANGQYRFSVFCQDNVEREDHEPRVATSFIVGNRSAARNERVIQSKIAIALNKKIFRRHPDIE